MFKVFFIIFWKQIHSYTICYTICYHWSAFLGKPTVLDLVAITENRDRKQIGYDLEETRQNEPIIKTQSEFNRPGHVVVVG